MTTDLWLRVSLFMAGLWVSTIWAHTEDRPLMTRLLMACAVVALWPAFQFFWLIDRAVFLYRRYAPHRRSLS